MKKMAVILMSLMIVACNTTTPPKKDTAAGSQGGTTDSSASQGAADQGRVSGGKLPNLQSSVYFEFAQADISAEAKGVILSQAEAAKGNKKALVTLEGNCDERGSSEYNLALGQRRADAVKKLMVAAGADGGQLKATSEGKEKPKLMCHEEKCWKENRRVDFVTE